MEIRAFDSDITMRWVESAYLVVFADPHNKPGACVVYRGLQNTSQNKLRKDITHAQYL